MMLRNHSKLVDDRKKRLYAYIYMDERTVVWVLGDEGNVQEDDARVDRKIDPLPVGEGRLLRPRRLREADQGPEGERNGGRSSLPQELAATLRRRIGVVIERGPGRATRLGEATSYLPRLQVERGRCRRAQGRPEENWVWVGEPKARHCRGGRCSSSTVSSQRLLLSAAAAAAPPAQS